MDEKNNNLYNQISDSLEQSLDNDVKICFQYSSIVSLYLNQLLSICGSMREFDISCCYDVLNDLKEYIDKESQSYEKLLFYSKDSLISKIEPIIMNSSDTLEMLRHRNKLQFTKNIFSGYTIKTKELVLDDIPDMRFDIFSVLIAFVHIKTFKNLKDKIDNLVINEDKDITYTKTLSVILNKQFVLKSCYNDLLEVLMIYNYLDIDELPDINVNIIVNKFNKIYRDNNGYARFSEVLFKLLVSDLSVMSLEGELINSPKCVFDYLFFVTRFDVILNYMNNEYLWKLYNYCNEINFKNVNIYKNVNSKIKRRIINFN